MGFFQKMSDGLKKTRESFSEKITEISNSFTKIDEDLFEELEEALILADVGTETALKITALLREQIKKRGGTDPALIKTYLKEVVATLLADENTALKLDTVPTVVLVIGVNGAGKTTTIGKLAAQLKAEGKKVLLAAADTFRAAAIDQLVVWSERAGVDIIRQAEGADPAAVVYDALIAGKARGYDVIICDTAGRLQNKKGLMDELAKIARIIARELPESRVETLLVLDATTGQNAVSQAKHFRDAAGLTGIVLTKLDGTAKGGVVIGIKEELGVPVKFVGIGEKIEDLRPFDPAEFADALFD